MLLFQKNIIFLLDISVCSLFFIFNYNVFGNQNLLWFFGTFLFIMLIYFSLKGFEIHRLYSPRFNFMSFSISYFLSFTLFGLFALVFDKQSLYYALAGTFLPMIFLLSILNTFVFRILIKKVSKKIKIPYDISDEILEQLRKYSFNTLRFEKAADKDIDFAVLFKYISLILDRIPLEIIKKDEEFFNKQIMAKSGYPFWQKIIDISLSALFFVLLIPIYAILSLFINILDGKPILFRQKRIGLNCEEFTLYKFRSLKNSTDYETIDVLSDHEKRSYPLGRFMRSLRLDEIPQLLNIFKGQMSLVGPRPEMIKFHDMCMENVPYYEMRSKCMVGITGWAQVCYKRSNTLEEYIKKTEYDLAYIYLFSPAMYFKSLFYTLDALVYRRD